MAWRKVSGRPHVPPFFLYSSKIKPILSLSRIKIRENKLPIKANIFKMISSQLVKIISLLLLIVSSFSLWKFLSIKIRFKI
jgi:hypothetical protein